MSHKTTIYLPDDLKAAVERESRRRGCSEAQVIRDSITDAIKRPRPSAALFDAEPFAADAERLLDGFGER